MEEKMPLLSVIVPVYNVEEYVERCLRSIMGQTYRNIEIVVVDDGATDSSGEICDRIAAEDVRITVIHTQNGGLSAARNVGLDNAHGEYIGFVDSDDWIEADMYSFLYNMMVRYDADITVCSHFLDTDDRSVPKRITKEPFVLDHDSAMLMLAEDKIMKNYAWDKLYKRELFDGRLRFPKGVYFEDVAVMYKIMDKAHRVVMHGIPKYHYIYRDAGISRQLYNERKAYDRFMAEYDKFMYMQSRGLYPNAEKCIINRAVHTVNHLLMADGADGSIDAVIRRIEPWNTFGIKELGVSLYMRRYAMVHFMGIYGKIYRHYRRLFGRKVK